MPPTNKIKESQKTLFLYIDIYLLLVYNIFKLGGIMSELNIEKILNNQPTQIEEKILKAIFKRNDVILDIIDIVTPNMFTLSDYSNIYTAMIEVYKNENVVNEETFARRKK